MKQNKENKTMLTEAEETKLPENLKVHKRLLKNGAVANTAGRPKGSLNKTTIETLKARELLETVGFNPLKKLIDQYESVCKQIAKIEKSPKPSQIAISNLENIKRGIAETLLKYSYKPIAHTVEQTIDTRAPLKITLGGLD